MTLGPRRGASPDRCLTQIIVCPYTPRLTTLFVVECLVDEALDQIRHRELPTTPP